VKKGRSVRAATTRRLSFIMPWIGLRFFIVISFNFFKLPRFYLDNDLQYAQGKYMSARKCDMLLGTSSN
jgi:hypothetical protein